MAREEGRASSKPSFWNERYAAHEHLFGTAPSPFVMEAAQRLAPGSEVVEVGAGEARTLIGLAHDGGHRVTAVDFSETALANARSLATSQGVRLDTIQADVRSWTPPRQWDAAIVTFLQLLPDERPALYRCLRTAVRPGGLILGQWFRPDHLRGDYARIGPSRADRMVPVGEVRDAFATDILLRCAPVDVTLRGSGRLEGEAAVVQIVVQRGTD
jgi:SAM-dependent methyltransferase